MKKLVSLVLAVAMLLSLTAAAFAAAGPRPAARRSGKITPWAPAHSAERMIAPRLCGSVTPSRMTMNASSPRSCARARISSKLL